jgi:molybdate transport system regulatory protein
MNARPLSDTSEKVQSVVKAVEPAAAGPTRLRLRILFGDEAMLGPGKADLLEHIRDAGSIAAAGRRMNMSYKRAWSLVETMNGAFREPLVERARGGPKGGGARLTSTGEAVLAHYRRLEARIAEAGSAELAAIRELLRDMSEGK